MKTSNGKCRGCYATSFCLFTERMKAQCKGPFKDREAQLGFLKQKCSISSICREAEGVSAGGR